MQCNFRSYLSLSSPINFLLFYNYSFLSFKKGLPVFHTEAGKEGSHAQWNNASDSTKLRSNTTVNICSLNARVTVKMHRDLYLKSAASLPPNFPHIV